MQSETKYTKQDLETMRAWSLQRKIQVTQTRIIEWIGRHDWHAPAGFFACKNLSFGAENTAGKLAEKVFWSKDFTRRAEPFPLIGKSRRKNNLRIGGVRRESRAGF